MRPADAVTWDVRPLVSEERAALLGLLDDLAPAEWARPSPCPGWSVQDVVAHVLGEDLGLLARERDGHDGGLIPPGLEHEDFVAALNDANQRWVEAARRFSPRQLRELLAVTGPQLARHLSGADLSAPASVAWAGPEPVPKWLDLARHFTERWVHQQQVRIALGRPELDDPRYLAPVLRTFAWSLPVAYADVDAPAGTSVAVEVTGPGGGVWTITRAAGAWHLAEGRAADPAAHASMPGATAWRLYTAGLADHGSVERTGPDHLTLPLLEARAIIV